jgi:hypothetical protein
MVEDWCGCWSERHKEAMNESKTSIVPAMSYSVSPSLLRRYKTSAFLLSSSINLLYSLPQEPKATECQYHVCVRVLVPLKRSDWTGHEKDLCARELQRNLDNVRQERLRYQTIKTYVPSVVVAGKL